MESGKDGRKNIGKGDSKIKEGAWGTKDSKGKDEDKEGGGRDHGPR